MIPPWFRRSIVAGLAVGALAGASPPDPSLADGAVGVLRQYCYRCHGQEFKVEGYNVLDRAGLVAPREGDDPYVTPGKPDASELWARFDEMPPKGKGPRPTPEERATIKRWIEAGAPFPAPPARGFVSDRAVLGAIRDHLAGLDRDVRPFYRYFTLTTLHNSDPARVTDDDLRLARAGVSKMLNSLSRKPRIEVPALLGPSGTVMAVDLRKLGWTNLQSWSRLLAEYPYGLKSKNHRDPEIRRLAEEVEELSGPDAGLVEVRADWFLDAAGRPRLYHALLEIPATAQDLERSQHVDVEADFLEDTLRRAGFTRSGVSRQMRLVDRHESDSGYFWKSYDFRKTDRAVNLFRFPLGPAFAANPFPAQAFTHAGGEIIFSLPNHLQGYMLVTDTGRRIDEGPPEIVFDANDAAGTSTIVNGISCMGCHKNGMRMFEDRILEGVAVADGPRRKVERLFAPRPEMDRLLKEDEARFLEALEKATGPFLKAPGSKAEARDFKEPVVPIAKIYQADLDLAAVAAELNLADREALRSAIRSNRRLERLGLGDLLKDGGAINRAEWGTAGRGLSGYQQASAELDRGTPAVFSRPAD